jgi:ribosome maturation factor RimP
MASKQEVLQAMISPSITALGCELWGLDYLTQGRYTTLRVFIDAPKGVTLEDCERVSRQISAILDVEDPITGEYTLEVSSPGMDRSFYKAEQYVAYVGETVSVRLRMALDGRRRFKGEILRVEGEQLTLRVDGKEIQLLVDAIDKANLEPRYDQMKSRAELAGDAVEVDEENL